jgi:hypothetical protein
MVAETFPVVADNHDGGRFQLTGVLQGRHWPTQLLVDISQLRFIWPIRELIAKQAIMQQTVIVLNRRNG